MQSAFSNLDWLVFGSYFVLLAFTSFILGRTKITTSRDFFLSKNGMPMFAVAISVLATSQSAATFLGAPEFSYAHDFTFIGFYFSALVAVIFVAYVLIPKFYEMKAVTVYELLEVRYGESAKKQAGVMFLIGRVLASGARLYIGALVISMILFSDITFAHVAISILILMFGALAYTYFGGVRSVILSDIVLWSGKVLEQISKDDKDTKALVNYNKLLNNHPKLETVLLPIRDGLTISRMK